MSPRKAISLYFTQLIDTRPLLAGKDWLELSYEPGPCFKLMLQQLLNSHLDVKIQTKEDEIDYLHRHFGRPILTGSQVQT